MAKFRRKHDEVQAVQFVDGRYGEAIDFCPELTFKFEIVNDVRQIKAAKVGDASVANGSWIVKNGDGSFEVKTNDEFIAQYEAA